MQINVPIPIFKYRITAHEEIKNELLRLMSIIGVKENTEGASLINTDWSVSRDTPRPYFELIKGHLIQPLKNIEANYSSNVGTLEITNYWFQQYKTEDWHGWHIHPDTVFSSVYYVELPKGEGTVFKIDGKEAMLDVAEGDYLIFPSCMEHCSKPNASKERKTIIGFNLNFSR